MKHTILSLCMLGAVLSAPVHGQDELIANPGFETWQNGGALFGLTPEDWETTMGDVTQETTLTLSGTYALRITARKTPAASGKLEQELRLPYPAAFTPGDTYELTLNYYTVTSTDGNDIQLRSYWWKGGSEVMDHDSDKLNDGTWFTSVGQWGSRTVRTTVPEGATSFYLALKVNAGSVVVFDEMSFRKVTGTDPRLTVQPATLPRLSTDVNVPVESKDIVVQTENLPGRVLLEVTGKNRDYFSLPIQEIAADAGLTTFRVTYNPAAAGSHEAMLLFDCEGASEQNVTLKLTGEALDPANPPVITLETESPVEFATVVKTPQVKTIRVGSRNIRDYLYVKVADTPSGAFTLSNTMLPKNQDGAELQVTFNPKAAGTYTQRLEFYSAGAQSVFVDLKGVATDSGEEEPQEGDSLPLDPSNPRTLLSETFDGIESNRPLSVDGWKNIAVQGKRAWWGYQFKDEADVVVEKTAKVTAYNASDEQTEMWLVTPPLDFKNAPGKVFTFRVMGNLLFDGQDAGLTLCYMDLLEGELFVSPIDIAMPSIADDNGDWREYHVNLEGQDLADVFFMGFCFRGKGGRENSATYYIDDVTFGRTDLPVITLPTTQLAEVVELGKEYTSPAITVKTTNLTEPVSLSLGGSNPSKFKLSTKTIPASGGSFTVSFASDQEGVHEAYVKLSSRGAADAYLLLTMNNKTGVGITAVGVDTPADVEVYDLNGRLLRQRSAFSATEATTGLPQGVYLIRQGTALRKAVVAE